jgi:hypothetical protein
MLWLLPLPAIAEFVSEHIAGTKYRPRRQAALSAIGGIAFGRGMARYLADPGDRLFWAVSITYSLVMVIAVAIGMKIEGARKRADEEAESLGWWNELQHNLDNNQDGMVPVSSKTTNAASSSTGTPSS